MLRLNFDQSQTYLMSAMCNLLGAAVHPSALQRIEVVEHSELRPVTVLRCRTASVLPIF